MRIEIRQTCGDFAENKDAARDIREGTIRRAVADQDFPIVLDFKGVGSSTQSFVHALISDIFQTSGEDALIFFEFANCNKAIKSLIATVIDYSLE